MRAKRADGSAKCQADTTKLIVPDDLLAGGKLKGIMRKRGFHIEISVSGGCVIGQQDLEHEVDGGRRERGSGGGAACDVQNWAPKRCWGWVQRFVGPKEDKFPREGETCAA